MAKKGHIRTPQPTKPDPVAAIVLPSGVMVTREVPQDRPRIDYPTWLEEARRHAQEAARELRELAKMLEIGVHTSESERLARELDGRSHAFDLKNVAWRWNWPEYRATRRRRLESYGLPADALEHELESDSNFGRYNNTTDFPEEARTLTSRAEAIQCLLGRVVGMVGTECRQDIPERLLAAAEFIDPQPSKREGAARREVRGLAWISNATDGQLDAPRVRAAIRDRRLKSLQKTRNSHHKVFVDEVMEVWHEFAGLIQAALQREQNKK